MKIFMTGATGYLGGNLAKLLTQEGHALCCLVRNASMTDPLKALVPSPVLCNYDGKMTSMLQLFKHASPDIVIHMASAQQYDHRPNDVENLLEANVQLGIQLAEAALANGCRRFINTASFWEFGDDITNNVPVSLHAAMKKNFREMLRYYQQYNGLEVTNLVLYDTYGPNDPRGKIVSGLISAIKTGQPLKTSPGKQQIYLSHVDDVCHAYINVLAMNCLPSGKCFAIRPQKSISLRELVDCLEKVTGINVPVAWGERPYAERRIMRPWAGPILPGWQTKTELFEGLAQLFFASPTECSHEC